MDPTLRPRRPDVSVSTSTVSLAAVYRSCEGNVSPVHHLFFTLRMMEFHGSCLGGLYLSEILSFPSRDQDGCLKWLRCTSPEVLPTPRPCSWLPRAW